MKVKYKVSKNEEFGLRPEGDIVTATLICSDPDQNKVLLRFRKSKYESGCYAFAKKEGDFYVSCGSDYWVNYD